MAREVHPQRTAALKAIIEHTASMGPIEGARAAKKLFPDVGVPTWKSWVKLARAPAVVEPAESFAVASHTVAPITPAVEPHGFDFDQRIAEMDAAARALIDYAWPIDPETGRRGRLKNPLLLKAGHAALGQSAGLIVKHREAVFNQAKMEEFFAVVIEEVGKVDRGVQRAVIARLRDSREHHAFGAGFTLGVGPA